MNISESLGKVLGLITGTLGTKTTILLFAAVLFIGGIALQ